MHACVHVRLFVPSLSRDTSSYESNYSTSSSMQSLKRTGAAIPTLSCGCWPTGSRLEVLWRGCLFVSSQCPLRAAMLGMPQRWTRRCSFTSHLSTTTRLNTLLKGAKHSFEHNEREVHLCVFTSAADRAVYTIVEGRDMQPWAASSAPAYGGLVLRPNRASRVCGAENRMSNDFRNLPWSEGNPSHSKISLESTARKSRFLLCRLNVWDGCKIT